MKFPPCYQGWWMKGSRWWFLFVFSQFLIRWTRKELGQAWEHGGNKELPSVCIYNNIIAIHSGVTEISESVDTVWITLIWRMLRISVCSIDAWYVDFVESKVFFDDFENQEGLAEVGTQVMLMVIYGYYRVSILSRNKHSNQHPTSCLYQHWSLTWPKRRTKKLVWIGWSKAWSLVCSWSWWCKSDEMGWGW